MKDYKLAVFIGRFQGFHNAHLEVIKQGLELADKVLVIVGSARCTLTPKNPFIYEQRKKMIMESVHGCVDIFPNSLIVEPLRDFYEQDSFWVAEVQNIVSRYVDEGDSVCLLGNYKDSSSYYINYFKDQWDFKPCKSMEMIDATTVRDLLWNNKLGVVEKLVPAQVLEIFKNYIDNDTQHWEDHKVGEDFGYLYQTQQYKAIKEYKECWRGSPFTPTFNTADAVVIQSGHVLLVKRGGRVGKNLFALPGGFVKADERIEDAALRELKEETKIKEDKNVLRGCIVAHRMFDHPGRSLIGRTITGAYAIKLRDGKLCEVKGGDDAHSAFWMSFADVYLNEHLFFDDHFAIIRWAMSQVGSK